MNFKNLSKALLLGGALVMTACSNDEPGMNNGDNFAPGDGDTAYMKIRIQAADRTSRSTTDGGYEYGTADENDVKNVRFYFFDNSGAAMDLTAYLVDPNNATDINRKPQPGENGTYENVEAVFAQNLLVLEDLTSNEYPTYMLTVLNAPNFQAGTNLTNTLELLANHQEAISNKNYFVMSTSTFKGTEGDKNHDNAYPFVTRLDPTDFYTTPTAATTAGNAVEVYVERLSAKVELKVAAEKSKNVTNKAGESFDIYELETTVAGGVEGDNTENTDNQLNTKLYLRVVGWALNSTVNDSYMSKHIDNNWDFTWQNLSWNIATDFRSYWGKSTVYGMNYDAIDAAKAITYVPTNELTLGITTASVAYCNENTNTPANVVKQETLPTGSTQTARYLVDSRVVTNVVLKTQVVDAEGEAVDMVQANGVLFRKDAYINYIINRAYVGNNALNIWVKTGESTSTEAGEGETTTTTTNQYAQIGKEFFELALPTTPEGTGDVDVVVKDDAFTGKTFYKYNAESTATDKYEEMTEAELATAIAAVKTQIAAVQPTGTNHAVIFDKGLNVYYIPVEHLAAANGVANNVEGYYGVVRNHWYKLSINSFSKVGHGIWDPTRGEDYVQETKPDEPEDPLYYLGAEINILSWKVVDQNVEL